MRVLIFIAVLVLPLAAHAADICTDARSTADILKCNIAQNARAQETLNATFTSVLKKQSGETLEQIKNVQSRWLEYRDQQCGLEAEQIEDGSLRRIQELRCLTRVSDERTVALNSFNVVEHVRAGEIAAQPRWMNALAVDNANVFWRYGAVSEVDLDCDGHNEFMLIGLRVDDKTGAARSVVSVSANPKTGRPLSTVLDLPISNIDKAAEDETALVECGFPQGMLIKTAVPSVTKPEATAEVAKASCGARVVVNVPNCPSSTVLWDGSAYVLAE